MKILIDKNLSRYVENIKKKHYVKCIKSRKLLAEYNTGGYDLVMGINISKLRTDGNTSIISIGNEFHNNDIDYVIEPPLSVEKFDRAVMKLGLTRTSKKYRLAIKTVESIINFKSEDAGNQTKNISCIVRLICNTIYEENIIHLSRDQIDQIVAFSTIHDIGKIGLPDEILLSTNTFTVEERNRMKKHPEIGAQMISDLMKNNRISNNIAYNIVKYHHEKFDGSGYPSGLQGNEIPIEARIVALADVYDALVTKRLYKKSFTHQETLKMLINDSGTHFDPYIVNCFLKNEDEIRILYSDDLGNNLIIGKPTKLNNNNKFYIYAIFFLIIIILIILIFLILSIWE